LNYFWQLKNNSEKTFWRIRQMKKILFLLLLIVLTGCSGEAVPDLQINIPSSAREFCESRAIGCHSIVIHQSGFTSVTPVSAWYSYVDTPAQVTVAFSNGDGRSVGYPLYLIAGPDLAFWQSHITSITLYYTPADFNNVAGTGVRCGPVKDANGRVAPGAVDTTDTSGIVHVYVTCVRGAVP
jgi:hypothetical protein